MNKQNIGRMFLAEIDEYLAKNLQNITCADIEQIYSQFFEDLKEYKGNSNGFTGLSEYLIFRLLYHLLGVSFERENAKDSEILWEFYNENYHIGQGVPIRVDNKKYYPDIVIYNRKPEKLIAVIEIKIYPTRGQKEIDEILKRFENIRSDPDYQETRALLIIFDELSEKGKIPPHLQKRKSEADWFDFLILKNNRNLCFEEMPKKVGLSLRQVRVKEKF